MELKYEPLTKVQALLIAADYVGEIGKPFHPNFEGFLIDDIQCEETKEGNWNVLIRTKHPIYPNMFITQYLYEYLNRNRIPFNPDRYGLSHLQEG